MKKSVELKERARIEKKICEVQKKKGINNLKNLKNIEELLKEDNLPGFKFILEAKRDKDTFDTYKVSHNFSPKSSLILTECKLYFLNDLVNKVSHAPLLYLDVNIDNDKQEKIEIFSNDDPNLVAEAFAKKHSLSDEKKIFLQRLIEDKLNENLFVKDK